MAETKESTKTAAPKAPRKKPERKAPKQSDFPNKLAWLKAMTEYEEKQAAAANARKVEHLDKRIASARAARDEAAAKLASLEAERAALVSAEPVDGEPEVPTSTEG